MAKKKTVKKKAPKKLKCESCGNDKEGSFVVRGSAIIDWSIDAVEDGEIFPEEDVDWDEVSFEKEYKIGCGSCQAIFDIPKGLKLTETWG